MVVLLSTWFSHRFFHEVPMELLPNGRSTDGWVMRKRLGRYSDDGNLGSPALFFSGEKLMPTKIIKRVLIRDPKLKPCTGMTWAGLLWAYDRDLPQSRCGRF